MNCVEKIKDTELPKYEDFYSKVSGNTYQKMNTNMLNIYGNMLTYNYGRIP